MQEEKTLEKQTKEAIQKVVEEAVEQAARTEAEDTFTDSQRQVAAKARDYFIAGFHCSESVIKAFNESYPLHFTPQILRMASGLGGGLGKAKCCCGTVSTGAIIISSIYGRTDMHGDDSLAFDLAKELHDRFKEKFTTVCCYQLTEIAQWGHPSHVRTCSEYVYGASLILADILDRCIEFLGLPHSDEAEA